MMTLNEIKQAVDSGKTVYYASYAYKVVKDSVGQWLVVCNNGFCDLLVLSDGSLNGREEKFFMETE